MTDGLEQGNTAIEPPAVPSKKIGECNDENHCLSLRVSSSEHVSDFPSQQDNRYENPFRQKEEVKAVKQENPSRYPSNPFCHPKPPPKMEGASENKTEKDEKLNTSPHHLAEIILEGNEIIKLNGIPSIYVPQHNCYRHLAGEAADLLLRQVIPEDYRDSIHRNKLTEINQWFKSSDSIPNYSYSDLKKRTKYLNFLNGTLRLKDMRFFPNSKNIFFEFFINAKYPYDYTPDETYFRDYLMNTFLGDEECIFRYQEILGVTISNIRDRKLMIFLIGPKHAGKTILLDITQDMVGSQFCSSLALSDIGDRFRTSELFGKWVNLGSEVGNSYSYRRIDTLKRITGNDTFVAEFKYQSPFQFRNMALLLFAMNEWPDFGFLADPDSLLSRIEVLPFPRSFQRHEWIGDLTARLLQEKDYIVYFAVQGLKRFIDNGFQFSRCEAADRIKQIHSLQQNSFQHFVSQHIRRDPKARTASQLIEKAYKSFCEKEAVIPVDVTIWGEWLRKNYGAIPCRGISYDGSTNVRGYSGIELI